MVAKATQFVTDLPKTFQSVILALYGCVIAVTSQGSPNFVTVGCWADCIDNRRDLPYGDINCNNSPPVTKEVCAKFCSAAGYVYGSVENGICCFCGNSYGQFGPSSVCTTSPVICAGTNYELCGGYCAGKVLKLVQSTYATLPMTGCTISSSAVPSSFISPSVATIGFTQTTCTAACLTISATAYAVFFASTTGCNCELNPAAPIQCNSTQWSTSSVTAISQTKCYAGSISYTVNTGFGVSGASLTAQSSSTQSNTSCLGACFATVGCSAAVWNNTGSMCYFITTTTLPALSVNDNLVTYLIYECCVAVNTGLYSQSPLGLSAMTRLDLTLGPTLPSVVGAYAPGYPAWWTVNLGAICKIVVVNVTINTTSIPGFYEPPGFNVGVLNEAVNILTPTPGNYSLCCCYNATNTTTVQATTTTPTSIRPTTPNGTAPTMTPPTSGTLMISVLCRENIMIGQYLIIEPTTFTETGTGPVILPLTQVDVYVATSFRIQWRAMPGARLISSSNSMQQATIRLTVDVAGDCMRYCINNPLLVPPSAAPINCDSFNYNSFDQTCELNMHGVDDFVVTDEEWQWYQPTYLLND